MSDADDQMGGRRPAEQESGASGEQEPAETQDEEADEASKESFPASDPPANY